jgi:hypothetical protein
MNRRPPAYQIITLSLEENPSFSISQLESNRANNEDPGERFERIEALLGALEQLPGARTTHTSVMAGGHPAGGHPAGGHPAGGYPTVEEILPEPFAWCDIPALPGYEMMDEEGKLIGTFEIEAFQMAQYPVTRAQFSRFLGARDGFSTD